MSARIRLAPLMPVLALIALVVPAHGEESVSQIVLSMAPIAEIDPHLYGVNYVWDTMPASRLADFARSMSETAHYRLARYPGGWAGEFHDWQNNRQLAVHTNQPTATSPGPDADALLAVVPEASFTTPSLPAIKSPDGISAVTLQSVELVQRYGHRVHLWEIGNEWWLQRGAEGHEALRRQNLEAYAALVARVVPAMKAVAPAIDIYVDIDWQVPDETATLRRLVGPAAWAAVDGIDVHTYVQPGNPEMDPSRLPPRLAEIRRLSGKEKIYDSEWAITVVPGKNDFGLYNANWTVLALRDLGRLHVTAAAYWPVVFSVPRVAFASWNYAKPFATGIAFGWMAQYYRGQALGTTGDVPAAAARDGDRVTVIAATQGLVDRVVQIPLTGTGLSRVVSAEVMYSEHLDDQAAARLVQIVTLPTTIEQGPDGRRWIQFVVNPGTPGRGADAEIARVTLQ